MNTETRTNLKTALGVVGLLAVWIDPATLTWVLFAAIGLWILTVPVLTEPVAARLRKRSEYLRKAFRTQAQARETG